MFSLFIAGPVGLFQVGVSACPLVLGHPSPPLGLARDFRARQNKNPHPEGVVLSLPLKRDKDTSCPLRGRSVVSGFVI